MFSTTNKVIIRFVPEIANSSLHMYAFPQMNTKDCEIFVKRECSELQILITRYETVLIAD